jgi:hypothetical protein
MSSHSSERTMNALEAMSPGTCHLLRLPLELRDTIYGMLLTTPYCTELSPTGSFMKFHLHTAILLANKQISAETTRVLYRENDFIILETIGTGLWLQAVPQFKLPAANKITSPVLRAKIALEDVGPLELGTSRNFITTPDGLEAIFESLWIRGLPNRRLIRRRDLCITLNFNLKSTLRYEVLSERVLKPWAKIRPVKELALIGDFKEPMRDHLQKCILEGLFPDDVATFLMDYNSLAEREDYDAAHLWWCRLNSYWTYVSSLLSLCFGEAALRMQRLGLWHVLNKSSYMYYEGCLKLVKAYLNQSDYEYAAEYAVQGLNVEKLGGPLLAPITKTKFYLSASLTRTLWGDTGAGRNYLRSAAETLHSSGLSSLTMDMSLSKLTEDLRLTLNNELIRLKSPWLCVCEIPTSPTSQSAPEWQVSVVSRSFWEWLELPEDRAKGGK